MEKEIVIELEEDKVDIEIFEERNEEVQIEEVERVPVKGAEDYEKLANKPQIEGVELIGNRSFEELGITEMTNLELEELLK